MHITYMHAKKMHAKKMHADCNWGTKTNPEVMILKILANFNNKVNLIAAAAWPPSLS